MSDPRRLTKKERMRALKRKAFAYGTPLLGVAASHLIGRKTNISPLKRGALNVASGVGGALLGRRLVRKSDINHLRSAGMRDIDSSMIRGVRNEPEGSYIKFNTGNVYRYRDVNRDELGRLADAESAGKYFNKHLKRRKHERMGKL
jgi:hypothetical protein